MKTIHQLCKYVLTLVLSVTGAQQLLSQDAFYIYRNDGEFDGFFFDQVVSMGYSKTDLEGEEHDVYVVQEIQTADSLYRIPLAAIDSVGFQQPEIILNPAAKDLDKTGLASYIQYFETNSYDGTVFMKLAYNTPANLVPKVGDVLLNFTNPNYGFQTGDNFSGLACKVSYASRYDEESQWYIHGEPVTELSDVFVQYISVEQVGYDQNGQVRRRVAGFDYDEETRRYVPTKRASGSGSSSLIDLQASLHHDGSFGSVNADVSLKAGMDIAYNISWKRIYFKLGRSFGFSITPGATLKASKDFEYEIVGLPDFLSTIYFPAAVPLFQTRPFPRLFIRGGGELAAKITLPTVGYNYHESLTFDSDKFLHWSYSMFDKGPDDGSANSQLFNTGDVELSLSGFVQIGTKFTGGVSTNDWLKKIMSSYIGLELFVGPKLEGSVSLSVAKLLQQGAYEAMAGSKISFHPISLDLAAKARVQLFWSDPKEATFFDASKQFGSKDLYLLPSFKKTTATFYPASGAVQCSTDAERSVFLQSKLGFGAYQNDELQESVFTTSCGFGIPAKGYTGRFASLKPGRYQIMPIVSLFDYTLPVRSEAKDVLVTPYLKIEPRELKFSDRGGEETVVVKTNAEKVGVSANNPAFIESIKMKEDNASFVIKTKENQTLYSRSIPVTVNAYTKDVGTTTDSVVCIQEPNSGSYYNRIMVSDRFGIWNSGFQGKSLIPCTVKNSGGILQISCNYSETRDNLDAFATPSQSNLKMKTDYKMDITINISNPDSCYVIGGTLHADRMITYQGLHHYYKWYDHIPENEKQGWVPFEHTHDSYISRKIDITLGSSPFSINSMGWMIDAPAISYYAEETYSQPYGSNAPESYFKEGSCDGRNEVFTNKYDSSDIKISISHKEE